MPLNVTGGVPPYTRTLSTCSLPPGLSIFGTTITGTPTTAGVYSATLLVRDSDQPVQTGTLSVALRITSGLTISTTSLPTAYPNAPYTVSLVPTGGNAPYRWNLIAGQLPTGLSFSAEGILQGTPSAQGSYSISVAVTDSTNQRTNATFTLTVASLAITTTALPSATPQTPYSTVLEATGGAVPYRWTIISGTLPAGLTLTPEGLIFGTPTAVTKNVITFQVTDSNAATASISLEAIVALPNLGALRLGSLSDPIKPATQTPITITIDTTATIDLNGTLSLQLAPLASGHEDDGAVLLRANGSAGRAILFTIPTGSKTAVFESGAVRLQSGTLAGALTLTASMPLGQTPPTATAVTHIVAAAPVITSAKVTRRDTYSLEIEAVCYSTTAEIHTANFAFAGTGTLPPPQTINVQALFNSWYMSQVGNQKGGVFTYTQKFNFTALATGLMSVNITLTNAIAPSTEFQTYLLAEIIMPTFIALISFAFFLIAIVTILVRRDRRERDQDRRSRARSIVKLDMENTELAAQNTRYFRRLRGSASK